MIYCRYISQISEINHALCLQPLNDQGGSPVQSQRCRREGFFKTFVSPSELHVFKKPGLVVQNCAQQKVAQKALREDKGGRG